MANNETGNIEASGAFDKKMGNVSSRFIMIKYLCCMFLILFTSSPNELFSQENKDTEWHEFSSIKHKKERNIIIMKEHINKKESRNIYVALVDLNGDGVSEVIAYIYSFEFCGAQKVCPLLIYGYKNNKLSSLISKNNIIGIPIDMSTNINSPPKLIGIRRKNHKDLPDIIVNKVILKWNGSNY